VLCGLGLLAWFLPAIVAKLTARSDVLPWVAAELPFEAQFESASLSWLAPILLHDVQIVERETGSQAHVKNVTTQQSLWNLVSDRNQPLVLDLEGFTGEIVVPRWKLTGAPVQMDQYLRALLDRSLPELPRDIDVRITAGHLKFLTPERELLTEFPSLEAAYSFRKARAQQRSGHRVTVSTNSDNTAAEAIQLHAVWQYGNGPFPASGLPTPQAESAEQLQIEFALQQTPASRVAPLIQLLDPAFPDTGLLTAGTALQIDRQPDRQLQARWQGSLEQIDAPSSDSVHSSRASSTGAPTTTATESWLTTPVRWEFVAAYEPEADEIEISEARAVTSAGQLTGSGTIKAAHGLALLDFLGRVEGDLQPFLNQLPPEIREHLLCEGLRWNGLRVVGPLSLPAPPENPAEGLPAPLPFTVEAFVEWDRLSIGGLTGGQGKVAVAYAAGEVNCTPLSFPLAEGTVRQLPKVNILQPESPFTLQQGPVLEGIKLNAAVTREWLKFAAPLLANSTAIEGKLSVSVADGAKGNFTQLEQLDLPGHIQLQELQVGPGPLVKQIFGVVEQIALLTGNPPGAEDRFRFVVADQSFPVRVLEGRVHHRDFGLTIGAVQVISSGSVGFDETLDLTLTIPLPAVWLQRGPLLQALQGEAIVVAVRGTIDQPHVDLRPVAEFGQRIGAKAAGGLIEKLLNGDLPRPLPPPPRPPRRRPQ
jgi:hypothetical protein